MQVFVFALVVTVAVSANAQPVGETGGPSSSKLFCEPGQTEIIDCYSCRCVADGSGWACKLMPCPNSGPTCVPGKIYKNHCNTCVCPPDGIQENADCLRMPRLGCPSVWPEDGALESPGESLTAGPTWRTKRQA